MLVNLFGCVLFAALVAPLRGFAVEWEGGTTDTYRGVTRIFRALPSGTRLYLTVEVVQTDFSAEAEFVSGVFANGALLLRSCDPGGDGTHQFFLCLVNSNVTSLVVDGVLNVTTTATDYVNMHPYEGNLLHVRYSLADALQPTAAPSARPSLSPTVKGSSSAPSLRPSPRPTTALPSLAPTTSAPSKAPNRGAFFDLETVVATNNVAEGVTHTFVGINETTVAYLEIDVIQTDFNDDDEYINEIIVNGVVVSTYCNPGGQSVDEFSNCLRNYEVRGTGDATVTVVVRAAPKVNCCPYQGYLLYVRMALTHFGKPTVRPTGGASGQPTLAVTALPSGGPSAMPSRTAAPMSFAPTGLPSTGPTTSPSVEPATPFPTLSVGFSEFFEGGTNDVRTGVSHRFTGLLGAAVFLQVEVFSTDFSDESAEYVDRIGVNGHWLSSYCYPGHGPARAFFICVHSADVTSLVDSAGSLTVRVTATEQVNSYPANGYLLYVRYTVSAGAFPSPLPTSLPSGGPSQPPTEVPTRGPTGAPSGVPSRGPEYRPTGHPTGEPSSGPTSVPSRHPTVRPSGDPSSLPTNAPSTLTPTFSADAWFEWMGSTKSMELSTAFEDIFEWGELRNWNLGRVPGVEHTAQRPSNESVALSFERHQALVIRQHITVRNFNISGKGTLFFAGENASLTVLNDMNCWLDSAKFVGISENQWSVVSLLGNTSMSVLDNDSGNTDMLVLNRIRIRNEGTLQWRSGNIIGVDTTIENSRSGSFVISAGGDLSILSDFARYKFLFFPNYVLNRNAQLSLNLPAEKAIRDISVSDSVRLGEGRAGGANASGEDLWTLYVASDTAAVDYYLRRVNHTQGFSGFNYTALYAEEVSGPSTAHRCAEICLSVFWCRSFDFVTVSLQESSCLLSRYYGFDVGGLSIEETTLGPSYAHYELQSTPLTSVNIDSNFTGKDYSQAFEFINLGTVTVGGSGLVTLDCHVSLRGHGSLQIVENATVALYHGGDLRDGADIDICTGRLLVSDGSFYANSSASAIYSSCGFRTDGGPPGGILELSGSLLSAEHSVTNLKNLSLLLRNGARMTLYTLPGVEVSVNEVEIRESSSLVIMNGSGSYDAAPSILRIAGRLLLEDDNSELCGKNISISADSVYISDGARISAAGMGHSPAGGVGAGTNHSYSASGGSHGGRGGPGLVDASGPAYGSTYFPQDFGSGGGNALGGPSPTLGGSGGGAIRLSARVVTIDGVLSADGGSPIVEDIAPIRASGAGGGAGGSVIVEATAEFRGSGQVRAAGAEGAFAGIVAAGGGGAGGRVALNCSEMSHDRCSFLRDGAVSIAGGRRVPVCNSFAEQAAPGTVFISAQNITGNRIYSVLTSSDMLTNVSAAFHDIMVPFAASSGDSIRCIEAGYAAPIFRPAHHLSESDASISDMGINLFLSLSGDLIVESEIFKLQHLIGGVPSPSGAKNSLKLQLGVVVTISAGVMIRNVDVYAVRAELIFPPAFDIGMGGNLILLSNSSSFSGLRRTTPISTRGHYSLGSVRLLDGATLSIYNNSVNVSDTGLEMMGGSVLSVADEDTTVVFDDSSLLLRPGATVDGHAAIVLTESSNITISGIVDITYIRLHSLGRIDLKYGGFLPGYYSIVVGNLFSVEGISVMLPCVGVCSLRVAGGSIVLSTGSVFHLSVPLSLSGSVYVQPDALLNMTGGANISSASEVVFAASSRALLGGTPSQAALYMCESESVFRGFSVLTVSRNGVLLPPSRVDIAVEVYEGGTVIFSDLSSRWNMSNFTVREGAKMNVSAATATVEILELSVLGGKVHIEGDLLLASRARVVSGAMTGSGSCYVRPGSILSFEALKSLGPDISTIREVSLYNYGNIVSESYSVTLFGSASTLYNYGNISFGVASYWGLMSPLQSSFMRHPSAAYIRSDWLWSSERVSVDTCAELCWGYDVKLSRKVGTARTAATQTAQPLKKCNSFEYNAMLLSCRLYGYNTSGYTGRRNIDIRENGFSWDIYDRISGFDVLPSVVNKAGGVIASAEAPSLLDLSGRLSYQNVKSGSALPAVGIFVKSEQDSIIDVSEDSFLGLYSGFDSGPLGDVFIASGGRLEVAIGSTDTTHVYQTFLNSTTLRRNDIRSSCGVSFGGRVQGNGTVDFYYSGIRPDFHIIGSQVISVSSSLVASSSLTYRIINVSLELASSMAEFRGASLVIDGGVVLSRGPIAHYFSDSIIVTNGGTLGSDILATASDELCDGSLFSPLLSVEKESRVLFSQLHVHVSQLLLSESSIVSTNGRGYGLISGRSLNSSTAEVLRHSGVYSLTGSSGGSHGGIGGLGYSVSSYSDVYSSESLGGYGSFELPNMWGSPGGCRWGDPNVLRLLDPDATGSGGGTIYIHADTITIFDTGSALSSDGARASLNTFCGGGSGGSIVISTSVLTNFGTISSNGGGGGSKPGVVVGSGGGGGGGRVSLLIDNAAESVLGRVTSAGGPGFESGSAGTVFLTLSNSSYPVKSAFSKLRIANNWQITTRRSLITDSYCNFSSADDCVDILEVVEGAAVVIDAARKGHTERLQVGAIVGDNSGTVSVLNGTSVSSPSSERALSSVQYYYGGAMTEQSVFSLLVMNITMEIKDATINATDLLVHGGRISLSSKGSADFRGRHSPAGGRYHFSSLSLREGGTVFLFYDDAVLVGHSCPPSNSVITINLTSALSIDATSVLHSDAQGCFGSTSGDEGDSDLAASFGGAGGGGGGHGGQGGHGLSATGGNSSASRIASSAESNFHWKQSALFGSGGGGAYPAVQGGRGGGVIRIAAVKVINNGTIRANGGAGLRAGAGGGSGGSILLEVAEFDSRTGCVTANGGSGLYNSVRLGGPGGGGVVSVILSAAAGDNLVDSTSLELHNLLFAYGGVYSEDDKTDPEDLSSVEPVNILDVLAAAAAEKRNGCQVESARIGPGAGIVHIMWGNGTSAVIIRGREVTSLVVTRSRNEDGVEVFERVEFDVCSRYTCLYSPAVENTSVAGVYIGNGAHLQVLEHSAIHVSRVVQDVSGLVTVSQSSTLYLPMDLVLSRGSWFVHGHIQGGDNTTIRGGALLSLYPGGRWTPCFSILNYTVDNYYARDLEASCSFLRASHGSNPWGGRLNTFIFFSLSVLDTGGIYIRGGSEYESYPPAVIELVGSGNGHNSYFYGLNLGSRDSFIDASGEGYSGQPALGSFSADRVARKETDSSNGISCGYGGTHAGPGGYCDDHEAGNALTSRTSSLGVAFAPLSWGGGGGASFQSDGGDGGGGIHILVSGAQSSIMLMGTIRVDGSSCGGENCGSGAGGSIWIDFVGADDEYSLVGSGVLSAVGGGTYLSNSLAGSGGRIAIYDSCGGTCFNGSVYVRSGHQNDVGVNYTQFTTVWPAAGSVYLQNTSSGTSVLLVTNQGETAGAGTTIISDADSSLCSDDIAAYFYSDLLREVCVHRGIRINHVLVSGGQIALDNVSLAALTVTSSLPVDVLSIVPGIKETSPYSSELLSSVVLKNDSMIVLSSGFSLLNLSVMLYSGHIVLPFGENVTIGPGGVLEVSQESSKISVSDLPTNVSSRLHSNFGIDGGSIDYGTFLFSVLSVYGGGVLKVMAVGAACPDPSISVNLVVANVLDLGLSSLVNASAIYLPTCSTDMCPHCGSDAPPNGMFGAAGGGHGGYGTPGAFWSNPGTPRGRVLRPVGSGGHGGSIAGTTSVGGAGGGGVRISVLGDARFMGVIDVSGGPGERDGAGGGAGGSLWVLVAGSLYSSGTGLLRANGGHAGVSSVSNSAGSGVMFYGGAGAGGRIHVEADSFIISTGSGACGLMFPTQEEQIMWPLGTTFHSEALGGLALLRGEKMNQWNDTVSAVFDEEALRYMYYQKNRNNTAVLVAGAAGSVVYSARSSGMNGTLFVRSWSSSDLLNGGAALERILNRTNSSNMYTAKSSLFLNSTDSDNVTFSRIYLEHGKSHGVVHNRPFSVYTDTDIGHDVVSLGTLNVREIFGNAAGKIVFDTDVLLQPSTCNAHSGCIACEPARVAPELIIRSAGVDLLGSMRVDAAGRSYDSNASIIMSDGSTLMLAASSVYVSGSGDEGLSTFTLESLSLSGGSVLYGENLNLVVAANVTLNESSAIHADGLSSVSNPHTADVGASGGSHGGLGFPGINSYHFYDQLSSTNASISASDIFSVYGDIRYPVTSGVAGGSTSQRAGWEDASSASGRMGGAGGGAVQLECMGTVVLAGGSRISADGTSFGPDTPGGGTGAGAGSGGSVHIKTHSALSLMMLDSIDVVSAAGGSTCGSMMYGGSGGGGRVSITVSDRVSDKVLSPINDGAINPFISAAGTGILRGGYNSLMRGAVSTSSGITMVLNMTDNAETLGYNSGACINYIASDTVDSVRDDSLWSTDDLTEMALQPSHVGTVHTDLLPAAIVAYNNGSTDDIHYMTWDANASAGNRPLINVFYGDSFDIYLTERPSWVKERIAFCAPAADANFSGVWRIGYRGSFSTVALSPFSTALDVLTALHELRGALPGGGVNVYSADMESSACYGFSYEIVFFSVYAEAAVRLISIDDSELYLTGGSAISVAVEYSTALDISPHATAAYALFNESLIAPIVNLSLPFFSDSKPSIAFWRQPDVLRVYPYYETVVNDGNIPLRPVPVELSTLVGSLYVSGFRPYPTRAGWFSSNASASYPLVALSTP